MTLTGALLFVIGHFLAIWLLTVAIGFAAGWCAKRRK